MRTLTSMGEPVFTMTSGTDRAHFDIHRTHTSPVQEKEIGGVQGESVAVTARLDGLFGITARLFAPGVQHIFADDVAAPANGRSQADMDVLGTRAKCRRHERERCPRDIRNSSAPSGMRDADGGAATTGSWIDEQDRLTVGMQRHQHQPGLVRDERISKPDRDRSGHGATAGLIGGDQMDVPTMNLTNSDQALGCEPERGAPPLSHGPGVLSVARHAESDVAMRAPNSLDAPGDPVGDSRNRG